MALTIEKAIRRFRFNGVNISDPGPEFTPEEIRDMNVGKYPDIATAVLEGPEIKNGEMHYTFVRNVGAKG